MIDALNRFNFILGSNSPRRQHLLSELGLRFTVMSSSIHESYPSELKREAIPVYLSIQKSHAFGNNLFDNSTILITADTIVWIDNRVVGKSSTAAEAIANLQLLSGRMHEVITGVCLRSLNRMHSFYVCSEVWFKHLLQQEIEYYVHHCKPFDKAGGYGIQEWIGYIGIERINGSFYNVMGLPLLQLYNELQHFCELR